MTKSFELPKTATLAEVKAILLANWPWKGNWGGMMNRMMDDMRRQGMLVACETRPGYYRVTWPLGVEMKIVEAEVEMAVGEEAGKEATETEIKK